MAGETMTICCSSGEQLKVPELARATGALLDHVLADEDQHERLSGLASTEAEARSPRTDGDRRRRAGDLRLA